MWATTTSLSQSSGIIASAASALPIRARQTSDTSRTRGSLSFSAWTNGLVDTPSFCVLRSVSARSAHSRTLGLRRDSPARRSPVARRSCLSVKIAATHVGAALPAGELFEAGGEGGLDRRDGRISRWASMR